MLNLRFLPYLLIFNIFADLDQDLSQLSVELSALQNLLAPTQEPGKTPLHKAAADCDKPIYDLIYDFPQEPKDSSVFLSKDGDGNIPLHEAAAFGCLSHVKELLEIGLESLWGSRWELSEPTLSQLRHKLDTLNYDIYVNAQNNKGETPLDKAHYFNKPEVEKVLKAYGGRYNIYKNLNEAPSHQELDNSLLDSYGLYQEIIALKRGANPDARYPDNGMTSLHALAQSADYKTPYLYFEILLAYGAHINALDNEGYTPYGRAGTVADSQTADYITSFFEKQTDLYGDKAQ